MKIQKTFVSLQLALPGRVLFTMAVTFFVFVAVMAIPVPQLRAQADQAGDLPGLSLVPGGSSTTDAKVNRWIAQLTDDSSVNRATARENLVAEGVSAIGALKSAAINGDPQTAYSSLRLLAEMVGHQDAGVSSQAKAAVTEIAEGKSASSRQAKKILEEAASGNLNPAAGANNRRGMRLPGMPFNGNGKSVSISRSTINDSERVMVKEDGRQIEIERDPRRIVVTIKDADGKESSFKAESEAELKKASKMAWDLVDKYMNQQNGVQIAIGRLGGGGVFGPGGLNGLQLDPFGGNAMAFDPFGRRARRRPGQKDSLSEMARLLKEVKDVATSAKKERDLDQLQSIIDKLDHMETHMELLRLERGQ